MDCTTYCRGLRPVPPIRGAPDATRLAVVHLFVLCCFAFLTERVDGDDDADDDHHDDDGDDDDGDDDYDDDDGDDGGDDDDDDDDGGGDDDDDVDNYCTCYCCSPRRPRRITAAPAF